jgi:hypothetical protein
MLQHVVELESSTEIGLAVHVWAHAGPMMVVITSLLAQSAPSHAAITVRVTLCHRLIYR